MKYKLLEHVSLNKVDDEVVLLDLDSGAYYGLNHIGAHLLQSLEADIDLETAIQEIAAKYQSDLAQVQQDMNALIGQLLEQKLISQSEVSK